MEKQASGLISLEALDANSGARGICRYTVGERCSALVTAAQLPNEAKYIAIIWAGDNPSILGEMKKTKLGWEAEGEVACQSVDAAFVALNSAGDLVVLLAGKAMGAKFDMDKALFKVRLMGDKKQKQRMNAYPAETAVSKAKVKVEESIQGLVEKAREAAPAPALERFVTSVKERAIAPRKAPQPEAKSAVRPEVKAVPEVKRETPRAPVIKQEEKPAKRLRPMELLRNERPDCKRCIGNPFPGRFQGCKWDLVTYPGAQHPHYLAGHWRRGGQELLVSAVPGEKAPHPPQWLEGFAEHQTSRWGQGYWIGLSDFRTGRPVR